MVRIIALSLVASLLLLAGCRTAPILNISDAPVLTAQPPTMQSVQNAIILAGNGLGWKMEATSPGALIGVLELRGHRAVVEVTYDTKVYSIKYKDSADLKYDGTNIHKNYNGWVENLDRAIRNQLAKT